MQNDYLAHKHKHRKTALKNVWIPIVFSIAFIFLVIKLAFSSYNTSPAANNLPTDEEVYSAAKLFIQNSIQQSNTYFPDKFELSKKDDHVYALSTIVQVKDTLGNSKATHFEIILHYKGGPKANKNSWELLNLSEDQ